MIPSFAYLLSLLHCFITLRCNPIRFFLLITLTQNEINFKEECKIQRQNEINYFSNHFKSFVFLSRFSYLFLLFVVVIVFLAHLLHIYKKNTTRTSNAITGGRRRRRRQTECRKNQKTKENTKTKCKASVYLNSNSQSFINE